MTTYLPRSTWTKVPAAGATMPPKPVGIAVHWPGTTAPIGSRSQANMAARLEGYRRFHVNGRGWSDIAYQVGIDQDGRVWDLRGIGRESAANGDQSVNLTYLACLFLLGPGEKPTPALLQAFTDWRRDKALKKYPTATRIVGHRDIRPTGGTDCPGPITEALIKAGQLAQSQEADVPLTDAEKDDIAARVVSKLLSARIKNNHDGKTSSFAAYVVYGNEAAWKAAHAAEATGAATAQAAADAVKAAIASGVITVDVNVKGNVQ